MLNNKVYDVLKYICLVALPAVEAFIIGLFTLWGFPYGDLIAGTIALVATLLGALLGISSAVYKVNSKKEDAEESEG